MPRGGRNPFLDTFDCPTSSATAPKRATTITPLQVLSLMNNSLVFAMADDFALRVQRDAGDAVDGRSGSFMKWRMAAKRTTLKWNSVLNLQRRTGWHRFVESF